MTSSVLAPAATRGERNGRLPARDTEPLAARRQAATWAVLTVMASADAFGFWNTLSRLIQQDTMLVLGFVVALAAGSVAVAHEIGRLVRVRARTAAGVWIATLLTLWLALGLTMASIRAFGAGSPAGSQGSDPLASALSSGPNGGAKALAVLLLVVYLLTGALAMSHAFRVGDPTSVQLGDMRRARQRLLADLAELHHRQRLADAQTRLREQDLKRDAELLQQQHDLLDAAARGLQAEVGFESAVTLGDPSATDVFMPPPPDTGAPHPGTEDDQPMRPTITVVSVLATLAMCSACSEWRPPHDPAGAVAIVVGARSNMPRPELTSKARSIVDAAFISNDKLYVVGVSGDPRSLPESQLSTRCDSRNACDGAVADFNAALGTVLAGVRADSAEADTLGAILIAARQLADSAVAGPKQIVVIDNGVQTTGDLLLQAPGALSVSVDAVVEQLGKDTLSNLAGVHVLFTGIGSSYDPQPQLSRADREHLEALWGGILTAGGARVTLDTADLARRPPDAALPPVTPVDFSQKPTQQVGPCARIREDQIGFIRNTADFVDRAKVREVLKPVAEQLKSTGLTATVIGTTALPESPPYPLSNQRSGRVADELVALGVPRTALTTAGVGIQFSGYVPPFRDGRFVETLAVQDRLVIISPIGQQCP